jgi:hypothetical protein
MELVSNPAKGVRVEVRWTGRGAEINFRISRLPVARRAALSRSAQLFAEGLRDCTDSCATILRR